MTHYSALTPAQQAHAQYLFADNILGTDPNAYEYQLKGDHIVARSSLKANRSQLTARKPHTVRVNVAVEEVPETYITVEMIRNAEMAIQEIARSLVAAMLQTQTQEA